VRIVDSLRTVVTGRDDPSRAFPEPDAGQAGPLAEATKDDFIAVFEERARLASGQAKGFGAMLHLEEASFRALLRPGDGTGSEQVAGAQVAAAAGVMRDELRRSPVEIAQIAAA